MNLTQTTDVHIIGQGSIGALISVNAQHQGYHVQHYVKAPTYTESAGTKSASTGNANQPTPVTIQYLDQQTYSLPPGIVLNDQSRLTGVVIIPVKAYQVAQILAELKGRVAPEATIVLLHNGMGSIELANTLFEDHVIIAATTTLAGFKRDKVVTHTAWGETQLGIVSHHTLCPHQAIIDDVLPGVTWHDDIYPALYTKLAINCVINPLTAILNVPNGDLSASHLHDDMHAIIHEVVEAARMVHVELTPSDLFATVLKVIHDTRDNFSSMQQDIAHGRKTEIEHINGYIVNVGRRFELEMTRNETLLEQVLAMEEPANLTVDQL